MGNPDCFICATWFYVVRTRIVVCLLGVAESVWRACTSRKRTDGANPDVAIHRIFRIVQVPDNLFHRIHLFVQYYKK